MKNMKITRYILSFAAAAGLLAACQTPEMVQVASPEDVVPASLHELEVSEIAITANNQQEQIKFSWERADYDVPTEVRYSLEAALTEDGKKVNVLSGLKDTTAVLTYEELNRILFNDLEVAEGQATPVKFFIGSVIYAGSSIASYPKVYSQPLTLTVTVTAAEKVYPMIYVIGDFNGWADGTTQELFEFTPESGIFSGMIGFGGKAANGWKIRGTASGWDDTCNWGLDGAAEAPAPEAGELTLISSGGSSDIKIYSKNFYNMTFDKSTLKLKMNLSFDQIGVIGSFNDWGADVVMNFDNVKQKFYADVEFAADAEFKFRLDGAWDISYGTGADGFLTSKDGANIAVKAGKYRVYLNMNNLGEITYELSKGDYGASTPEPEQPQEPEQPEQPAYKGWGIVGSAVGSWDVDTPMTSDGTWHVAKQVALTAGELKFRLDGAWATNLGGATFEANKELALTPGGDNIVVPAGSFDIYLDPTAAKVWFINDGSYPGGGSAPVQSDWGLIGSMAACSSWANNIPMLEKGDYIIALGVQFVAGDQFKFRKGSSWGTELTYEGQISIDAKLDLVDGTGGKKNSSIGTSGTFDVYLAKDLSCFYVMTPGKTPDQAGVAEKVYSDPSSESFVVGFSGSVVGWDDPSFATNDRASFVSKNVTDSKTFAGTYEFKLASFAVAANDEFKLRIDGQWVGVGGAAVEGLTVSGTDNFIAGESGTYSVKITFAWDGSNFSDVKLVFSK